MEKKDQTEDLQGSSATTLLYCDNCKHLEPKEHEQTDRKEQHKCLLLDLAVFHVGHHPRLPRLTDCPGHEI